MNDHERVPLGIPDLDFKLDGGVLPGHSVLSIGEMGAGYRELIYTSATIHGNYQTGSVVPDLGDYYGNENHQWPDEVQYVSIARTRSQFERELSNVINQSWAEHAFDGIEFESFADEFMNLSTVSRLLTGDRNGEKELAANAAPEISDAEYRAFLRTIGNHLLEHGENSFVILDGLTHLVPLLTKAFDWQETFLTLTTFNRLLAELNAVFLTPVDVGILSHRERGMIGTSFDGVLEFSWGEANATRRRVMTVKKFRELLATVGEEELARFELDLEWGGVGIKNIRKIPV